MKYSRSIGISLALLVSIGSACLKPAPSLADDCQPYWTEAYKRMQGCGSGSANSGGNSGPSRREIRDMEEAAEDAARAERNRRVSAINQQGNDAWQRGDYRQALHYYEQQQTVIDGPNVREVILQAKALIAWQEAKSAADYRRALALRPGLFSQGNIRYVEELEAKEKYERERPEREAQWERDRIARDARDLKATAKMREKITGFAAALDTAPATPDRVVTPAGTLDGAMGTPVAEAPLEFGNPEDLEAQSEQLRRGFDKTGLLKGSRPIAVVDDPASHDPRMIAATQELDKLQAEHDRMDAEIARLTRERNSSAEAGKMKALTVALEQKNQAKQEKLVQISQRKEKTQKLRRTINTEVEKPKDKPK